MALHEGRYLGERPVPLYVLCVGLALLRRRKRRSWHAWLLLPHQSSYLGKDLRVVYVLLLGAGALALLATGLGMTSLWRRRSEGLGR